MKNIYFFLNIVLCLFLIFITVSCSDNDSDNKTDKPELIVETDIKLGAYFFGAWYDNSIHLSSWSYLKEDPKYNRVESIWGWENCKTPEFISEQIDKAKKSGISFFIFDWYHSGKGNPASINKNNKALEYFKTVNNKRMQYCLLAVNEPNINSYVYTPEFWNQAKQYWLRELNLDTNPNYSDYLKLDGKPLLIIYDGDQLIQTLGGGNHSVVKQYLDELRRELNNNIVIGVCNTDIIRAIECGFDILTGYNYHVDAYRRAGMDVNIESSFKIEPLDRTYLYDADMFVANRFLSNHDLLQSPDIKFIPTATLNWDVRASKLEKARNRQYFEGFDENSVHTSVSNMVKWIEENASSEKTTSEKIGFIYAWNEYNEGAWLTPSASFKPLNGVVKALNENK